MHHTRYPSNSQHASYLSSSLCINMKSQVSIEL
uniref:Uncharacterized protein n=1 Tax=Arundo donax TaxID=35708 RepID=A0A0A8ZSG4_ARUDO